MSAIAESVATRDFTFGEFVDRLQGRVYTMLLVLLPLPFCQPIALPGLSTPFGVIITLLGLRFAFRQKPWLPRSLLRVQIPSKFLPAVLRGSAKLLRWIERFLHPRMTWLFDFPATQALAGCVICSCGLLLLLPLPVPFSNLFPALTVVLLAASVSERDGAMFFAGITCFALTIAFFALIFLGGVEVLEWIKGHFHGFFDPVDETPGLVPPTGK